jgi:hypothetical protein
MGGFGYHGRAMRVDRIFEGDVLATAVGGRVAHDRMGLD